MNEMLMGWLVLLIICMVAEVATMGLVSIWFAGGAFIALIAAGLGTPFWVQLVCFLVISLLLLWFTRPLAMKYFNKDRVKTNVDSLIGKQAIVTEEINNLQARGQVTVNGAQWSARCAGEVASLSEGAVVDIVDIQGVKLLVKAHEQEKSK